MKELESKGDNLLHNKENVNLGTSIIQESPKQDILDGEREARFVDQINQTTLETFRQKPHRNMSATPTKQRFNLGVASSYYFKDAPKTPTQLLVDNRLRNLSIQRQQSNRSELKENLHDDDTYENTLDLEGILKARLHKESAAQLVDTSMESKADSETSQSVCAGDLLNRSVLSDTTELTAANFVLITKSRQSLSKSTLNSFASSSGRKSDILKIGKHQKVGDRAYSMSKASPLHASNIISSPSTVSEKAVNNNTTDGVVPTINNIKSDALIRVDYDTDDDTVELDSHFDLFVDLTSFGGRVTATADINDIFSKTDREPELDTVKITTPDNENKKVSTTHFDTTKLTTPNKNDKKVSTEHLQMEEGLVEQQQAESTHEMMKLVFSPVLSAKKSGTKRLSLRVQDSPASNTRSQTRQNHSYSLEQLLNDSKHTDSTAMSLGDLFNMADEGSKSDNPTAISCKLSYWDSSKETASSPHTKSIHQLESRCLIDSPAKNTRSAKKGNLKCDDRKSQLNGQAKSTQHGQLVQQTSPQLKRKLTVENAVDTSKHAVSNIHSSTENDINSHEGLPTWSSDVAKGGRLSIEHKTNYVSLEDSSSPTQNNETASFSQIIVFDSLEPITKEHSIDSLSTRSGSSAVKHAGSESMLPFRASPKAKRGSKKKSRKSFHIGANDCQTSEIDPMYAEFDTANDSNGSLLVSPLMNGTTSQTLYPTDEAIVPSIVSNVDDVIAPSGNEKKCGSEAAHSGIAVDISSPPLLRQSKEFMPNSSEKRSQFLEILQHDLSEIGKGKFDTSRGENACVLINSYQPDSYNHTHAKENLREKSKQRRLSVLPPKRRQPSMGVDATAIRDSPARNTRNAKKSKIESDINYPETDDTVEKSLQEDSANISINLASSRHRLSSSLRKPGSLRNVQSGRRVAFGTPEVAVFNKGSPSMRFTPILSSNKFRRLTEDTQEIATDMNALLMSVAGSHFEEIASTRSSNTMDVSPANHSDMSLASDDNEKTNMLETSIADLFGPEVMPRDLVGPVDDERASVEADDTFDENTMELESNLLDLIDLHSDQHDAEAMSTKHSARRRFSLKQGNRLSFSTDDKVDKAADVVSPQYDGKPGDEDVDTGRLVKQVFDLKALEIFDVLQPISKEEINDSDLLRTIASSSAWPSLAKYMAPLFEQVMEMLIEHTEADFDDNVYIAAHDEHGFLYSLQNEIRSSDLERITGEVTLLQDAIVSLEKDNWTRWLISVVETLVEQFDLLYEKMDTLNQNAKKKIIHADNGVNLVEKLLEQKHLFCRWENGQENDKLNEELGCSLIELKKYQEEFTIFEDYVDIVASCESLLPTLLQQKNLAESKQRAVASICALQSFPPLSINPSVMSFRVSGNFSSMRLNVACIKANDGRLRIVASSHTNFLQHKCKMVKREDNLVTSFVDSCVASLCGYFNCVTLECLQDIGRYLTQLKWHLGRLEVFTLELNLVRRRYQTILSPCITPNFNLLVEFGSPAKIQAHFKVTQLFLCAPMELKVTAMVENVNCEEVNLAIKKSPSARLWSIAHTCAIIAAIVDQDFILTQKKCAT